LASRGSSTPIRVVIDRIEGVRINTDVNPTAVTFDVDVSMEEEKRTNGQLTVNFLINVNTKPAMVKFEVGGKAIVTGGHAAFEAVLEIDDKTNVPRLLHVIYQNIFTSLFLISTQLKTPYPPPDLIHSPVKTRDLKQTNEILEQADSEEEQTSLEVEPSGPETEQLVRQA
jgi:hypothetical protein